MISVVIPLYNKKATIERSLRSVLSQSYGDFEVVVVNDGSTDGSMDVVRSILDDRIIIVEQENGGPSKARNTGVKHCHGDWIVFLDADDELLPDALGGFAHCIAEHSEANFIACPFYCDIGTKKVLKYPYSDGWLNNPFKAHFLNNFYTRTGSFICKKNLIETHPFCEYLRRYEDFEAWFRIYKDAIIYLCSVPSMVVNSSYVEASQIREDINEDFLGHLDFKGKSFWEYMCLYKLYLCERPNYKNELDRLHPILKYRYDLLLILKLVLWANYRNL